MTDLKQLEETIAVHGGDAKRWPEGRAEALRSVVESGEGVALLQEARKVEAVLDAVDADGDPNAARLGQDALLARIMAATVDAPEAAVGRVETRRSPRTSLTGPGLRRRGWLAGGLLAASLLIGVVAGLNGIGAAIGPNGLVVVQGAAMDGVETAEDALLADLSFDAEFDLGEDIL